MKTTVLEKILNKENIKLNEVIQVIKDNPIFQETMSNVKEQFFIEDSIHGISHNERVVLLACYIGIKEGLNNEELRLVLEAAKYHDIGRGFEGNHGQTSATIIERNRDYIFPNLNDEEINIIKALCHGHSVDDKQYEEVARLYEIEDVQNFKRLLDIVKDADALDRVRLPRFGGLDEKYLRTEISKEIIDISRELFREYRTIQQNLVIDNSKDNRATSNYEFGEELKKGLLFDGENYYLVRSLNKSDIESLDNGNGIIPKVDSMGEHTVQDIMAQIRMQHRKTNLISMSEDPNIVLTYDKSNLHRFVLIKLSKDEIENSRNVFSAGGYLLGVMDYQIENIAKNAPENVRKILERVDNASSIDEVVRIINGADRQVPTSLVETKQQYLSEEEQLEQSKKIAKCKVLNYYGLMRNITHDERGKLIDISGFTQIMRNGYSSSEWLHSGKIEQENIVNIPKILVDSLALVKQAEFQGKDKETLRQVEQEILRLAISGTEINQDNYQLEYSSHENLKSDLTIDRAYEITNGQISYRDTNMQMIAIRSLAEMTLNKRKIIELLQERLPNVNIDELLADTYCVNQEMVTRQNNRGSQIGRNISFIISDYGCDFDEELSKQILKNVQNLTSEQLVDIISKGADAPEITDLLVKTRENDERIQANKSKRIGSKYIAEAIIEGYKWKKDCNSLTKDEKTLIANRLLTSVMTNNELYKLYEAINKIQIGKNKFTQNDIFAIMINLAIDGKIGDVSYKDLTKKDISEIQLILLENKESLQTLVLPISVDLLAGRGREVDKLKQNLIDLGLEKDLIEQKDIKNVYVAKQIVDGYDFEREISEEEKRAILVAILNCDRLNKTGKNYLVTLIRNMEQIGLTTQEIYGTIINLGVNKNVVEDGGYSYSILLANRNICQEMVKYKGQIQTEVTEGTIFTAKSLNLSEEEQRKIKEDLINWGIDKEFIEAKNILNLYMGKQIIEEYDFGRTLNTDEKKVLLIAVLNSTLLNLKKKIYLTTFIKNMEKIGLNTQEIYGMIINLGVNGNVLEQTGFGYDDLLSNGKNACQKIKPYKNQIEAKVTEMTILTAKSRKLDEEEKKRIELELINLGIDKDFINSKDLRNLYVAKKIVEGYDFGRIISEQEKKALIKSVLDNSTLGGKRICYLSSLMKNMEQIGLNRQEIYGMIINLGVNGNVLEQTGFGYDDLLSNGKNACQKIKPYKNQIETKVTEGTILTARTKNLTEEEGKRIKHELNSLGIDKDFIDSKDIRNLYVAKKIVEGYDFGRIISEQEKKALIKSVLDNSKLDAKGTSYLTTFIRMIEQIECNKQEIYGMIINLGVNGKVIEKAGYSYAFLLSNTNNACQSMKKYKNEIETKVSEGTILTARSLNLNEREKAKIEQELTNWEVDKAFIGLGNIKNLYVAKQMIEEYDFGKTLSADEKKSILKLLLNSSKFCGKKCCYLTTWIRNLERTGLNIQDIYGMIMNFAINGLVINGKEYTYNNLINNKNNIWQNIIEGKCEIQTQVTEETIQNALEKANKPKKVKGQDIAKSTMELTVEGSGGSQICDDVQSDYQRLLNEKTKKKEIEGSEQDVPN